MSRKPRVGILTSLVDYSPGYSLTGIILDQARQLKRARYPYDLLCLKAFNAADRARVEAEGLSARYVLPQTTLVDYRADEPPRETSEKEVGFSDQVNLHMNGDPARKTQGYLDALGDYDVVISHDIMFLSWHLPQNAALRACIERWPEKNWLHWIHSAPSIRPPDTCYPSTLRYECAPDSTYVFLNESQRHDCALMLSTTRENVAVVYNPKDPRDVYGFAPETCELIDRYDLFNHDVLQVYPFSTPRWREKGVRQLLKLFGAWKAQGLRARLVLVNCHCNSKCDEPRVEAIEKYAREQGLDLDRDVIMSSRFSVQTSRNKDPDDWRHCVPANVVRELGLISNLFVFPSVSECCSLIQAEASIAGKFVVLNSDFHPMREFCHESVLSFEFSQNDPDENPDYYECVAREVWAEMKTESAVVNATEARNRTYNRDWIFRNQFEPLLWKKGLPQRRAPAETAAICVGPEGVTFQQRSTPNAVPDYHDPQPGDKCPIHGECSTERREACYAEAGHCPNLDEVPAEVGA